MVSNTIKADVPSVGVQIVGASATAGIHSEARLAAEAAAWVGGLRAGLVEGKGERDADLEEGAEFGGGKKIDEVNGIGPMEDAAQFPPGIAKPRKGRVGGKPK